MLRGVCAVVCLPWRVCVACVCVYVCVCSTDPPLHIHVCAAAASCLTFSTTASVCARWWTSRTRCVRRWRCGALPLFGATPTVDGTCVVQVCIVGLSEQKVTGVDALLHLMEYGNSVRYVTSPHLPPSHALSLSLSHTHTLSLSLSLPTTLSIAPVCASAALLLIDVVAAGRASQVHRFHRRQRGLVAIPRSAANLFEGEVWRAAGCGHARCSLLRHGVSVWLCLCGIVLVLVRRPCVSFVIVCLAVYGCRQDLVHRSGWQRARCRHHPQ
jgi:hypothetical protein